MRITLVFTALALAVASAGADDSLPQRIDAAVAAGRWDEVRSLATDWLAAAPADPANADVARTRHVLGIAEAQAGNFAEALECLEAAAAGYDAAGAGPAERSACADEAGRTAHAAGRFEVAERWLRQAIAIRRESGDTALAAASATHLAEVLLKRGKPTDARREWTRALTDAGDDAAVRTLARRGLGVLAHTLGAWDEAVRQFELARSSAAGLGESAAAMQAAIDGQLGQSLLRLGDERAAESRLTAAERFFAARNPTGPEHAAAANNLAEFHLQAGRPEAAERLLTGILRPDNRPEFAGSSQAVALWLNLGAAEHRTGNRSAARESLQTAATLADTWLPDVHPLRAQIHLAAAALARDAGNPDNAAREANEASRLAIAWLHRAADGADDAHLLDFRRTLDPVSPLVALAPHDVRAIASAIFASHGAALDLTLARHRRRAGAASADVLSADTPESVAAALPKDGVLVNFVRWRDCAPGGVWDEAGRYGALVVRPAGDPEWIDLGPAPPLESRVRRVIAAARDTVVTNGEPTGGSSLTFQLADLRKQVWDRVAPTVDGARRILLRPDGMLHFVPWAVLRRESADGSHCFCDDYPDVEIVAFPRRARSSAGASRRWTVLAVRDAPAAGIPHLPDDPEFPLTPDLLGDLAQMPALPGVDSELEAIRDAAGGRIAVDCPVPVESSFATAGDSAVIHFAGHGFALEDSGAAGGAFVRAGLVMADCAAGIRATSDGHPLPPAADGILFAADAAALPLSNAPFVVLSGCQTGLGHWHAGDHLTGLRHAFLVAGAGAVASTLWDLNDAGAPETIRLLYGRIAAGDGPARAVWTAQREWLAAARNVPEPLRSALAGAWLVESAGWQE